METQENIKRTLENDPDGISDDEADNMVPQIQRELDRLNHASTEINRLENELDEARSKYRSIITETSAKMEAVSRDIKKSIHRAREYYRLKEEAKSAQGEALKAARQFQSATGVYKAAKETVALAECRLIEETDTPTAQLSSAWQEMLSHAISKVNEAEREKSKGEQEHKRRAQRYAELEGRIQFLEQKYGRSIKKAKTYFDLKTELDIKLMQQKHNVTDLQAAIKANKMKYSESFKTLEAISDEIHISRNNKLWSMFPRLPGVGSDNFSIASSLSDLGLEQPGSTTDDYTSIKSDADTETSGQEGDDDAFSITIESRTVNFTTEKTGANKSEDDSLPVTEITTEISDIITDSCKTKQGQQKENENLAVKDKENDSGKYMEQNSDEINSTERQTIQDNSETNDPNMKAVNQIQETQHRPRLSETSDAKESSLEDNSDDINEEDYESCDEGDISNDKESESENTAVTKGLDTNTHAADQSLKSTADLTTENEGLRNNEQSGNQTNHGSDSNEHAENQVQSESSQSENKCKDTNKMNANDTAIDNEGANPADMRNVERPSLSGAED